MAKLFFFYDPFNMEDCSCSLETKKINELIRFEVKLEWGPFFAQNSVMAWKLRKQCGSSKLIFWCRTKDITRFGGPFYNSNGMYDGLKILKK